MARGGGGGSHHTAYGQYRRNNTVNHALAPNGLFLMAACVAFFFAIYIIVFAAFWFFSTPFGQKTMAVSVTMFTIIYTYTYPFWWVLGKIWDQIKCVALWLWTFVFYPVGNFIYWVFT
jgi:hypothetical protein